MRTDFDFSIVIPVLNEAESINFVINQINTISRDFKVEIIVADGDKNLSTNAAIEDKSVIKLSSLPGRSVQMNTGAEAACGDIILFLHADTILPDNAFHEMADAMADPSYVGGAFSLGFASNSSAMRFIAWVANIRTKITRVPFGDQAIFLRREYFLSIGGFKEIPLMEDVELMNRIKKHGDRIRLIPSRVRTSARKWEREGVFRTNMRNWSIQIMYLLGVSPERLFQYYYTHKKN